MIQHLVFPYFLHGQSSHDASHSPHWEKVITKSVGIRQKPLAFQPSCVKSAYVCVSLETHDHSSCLHRVRIIATHVGFTSHCCRQTKGVYPSRTPPPALSAPQWSLKARLLKVWACFLSNTGPSTCTVAGHINTVCRSVKQFVSVPSLHAWGKLTAKNQTHCLPSVTHLTRRTWEVEQGLAYHPPPWCRPPHYCVWGESVWVSAWCDLPNKCHTQRQRLPVELHRRTVWQPPSIAFPLSCDWWFTPTSSVCL